MAKQLELRRGTTQANNLFTGATGELTMDTDTKQLRVHDGVKTGGYAIDTLVAFQVPNAGNNYTWYRKYASGWVEQGGYGTKEQTITLPVEMANANYGVLAGLCITGSNNISYSVNTDSKTTTSFRIRSESSVSTNEAYWEAKGMAA